MVFPGVSAISFECWTLSLNTVPPRNRDDGLAGVQSGAQGDRVIRSCQLWTSYFGGVQLSYDQFIRVFGGKLSVFHRLYHRSSGN